MPFADAAYVPYTQCPTCLGGGAAAAVVALNDLTDVTLTPPLNANQVLRWNGTQWVNAAPAGTQMYELGGSSGPLAIGDGVGVATPVALGWTLLANQLHGRVTTAPTGSAATFQVRLMPGNTVISTGTIAAGATTATFTPFVNQVFADGQWIEVVVTGIGSTTPGSELTVMGEIAGP